jgi:hypothetical protein
VMPGALPLGRLRFATSPCFTGSPSVLNTMGAGPALPPACELAVWALGSSSPRRDREMVWMALRQVTDKQAARQPDSRPGWLLSYQAWKAFAAWAAGIGDEISPPTFGTLRA